MALYVRGIKHDEGKTKTSVVKNNGFNPVWKHKFSFTVHRPELAMLLFIVSDKDLLTADDLIGQYSLPLTCLRQGYRTINLKGRKGEDIENSTLLIKTRIL